MASTVVLAQVLGLFLVIMGGIMLLRRHAYVGIIAGFVRERMVRLITGVIELIAGLFLVVLHQDWSSPPAMIITLLGWLAVVESITYLTLPDPLLERVVNAVNRPGWYLLGGALVIALGLYLAGWGFGHIRV